MHGMPEIENKIEESIDLTAKFICLKHSLTVKEIARHTIATSSPPPNARPSMAATEGFLAAEK